LHWEGREIEFVSEKFELTTTKKPTRKGSDKKNKMGNIRARIHRSVSDAKPSFVPSESGTSWVESMYLRRHTLTYFNLRRKDLPSS